MSNLNASATFATNGARVTVELRVTDYVSFTGTMDGGGQIVDRLREHASGEVDIVRLCDLWGAYHLERAPFDAATETAIAEATALLAMLDGGRFGSIIEAGSDDFEDATFSNADDIIDSRDVVARIEYLRDFLSDLTDPTPETYDPETDPKGDRMLAVEELAKLVAFEDDAESYADDWRYGATLIRDDHFEDYAEEFAEDCGLIQRDAAWPNNCIDWSAAARQLQQDYTSVEFDGVTYWVR